MASMTITIPDNQLNDVVTALSTLWGWSADTGLTRTQYVRQYIERYLELAVKRGKRMTHNETFVPPADVGIDVT